MQLKGKKLITQRQWYNIINKIYITFQGYQNLNKEGKTIVHNGLRLLEIAGKWGQVEWQRKGGPEGKREHYQEKENCLLFGRILSKRLTTALVIYWIPGWGKKLIQKQNFPANTLRLPNCYNIKAITHSAEKGTTPFLNHLRFWVSPFF